MRHVWQVIALALAVSAGALTGLAQDRFEAPAVLRAADVVPPELLRSPVYTIDERVTTDGLLTKTVLRSALGEFVAEGPEWWPSALRRSRRWMS